MAIGAGRRVESASEGAAGDFAGPRNSAICENPYLLACRHCRCTIVQLEVD
jgi:hypothetical protein